MTLEKQLIENYYNKNKKAFGDLFFEVTVGQFGVDRLGFPKNKLRHIDAVWIPISGKKVIEDRQSFKDFLDKNEKVEVEVIEAKRKLNRLVIGQSIVGADLLYLDYYQPFSIKQVILCEIGDPLLEMICERRGIKVWKDEK